VRWVLLGLLAALVGALLAQRFERRWSDRRIREWPL
jgi:hypothetical protein